MIEIFIATYNGEKYISEQLNSILTQSFIDFHITICDSGTTDSTSFIIQNYINIYPNKISILIDVDSKGSSCKGFSKFLVQSTAEYIAFCAKNDIWEKDRLSNQIEKIQQLEELNGKITPIFLYSNSKSKHKKFAKKSRNIEPPLRNLLVENVIKESSYLINKSLLMLVKKMPDEILIYEWWIALIAVCFGEIKFVNQSHTLLLKNKNSEYITYNNNSIRPFKSNLKYSYMQAELFLFQFSKILPLEIFKTIGEYACLSLLTKNYKIKTIISKGFMHRNFKKLLYQIVFC